MMWMPVKPFMEKKVNIFHRTSRFSSPDTDSRSARAARNIVISFIIKSISVLINMTLVPLTIHYLSPAKYGVWLTISSMLGWISFFDIGLGHGLRNKLAEALAKDEMHKARAYVSTAYFSISVLCVLLFLVFLVINHFTNWNTLLHIPAGMNEDLNGIALLLFFTFCIQFILQLINSILLSNQEPALVSLFNMISNLLVLAAITILVRYSRESLLHISFIFSSIPVVVLAIVNLYYFRNRFSSFSPRLRETDFGVLKDVLSLGLKFFIIQLSVLLFFQTSNFLICRYFSPDLVTPYNIAFRYFGLLTILFSIVTAPYWSACTEAYMKQDLVWIRKSLRTLVRLWLVLVLLAMLMLFFADYAYSAWVGKQIRVDFSISFFMMLYTLIVSFGNIFIMVLNGISHIRLQMLINLIGMILFIPLSHYLSVTLHLGIPGMLISTIICSSYGTLVAPFEVKRVLDSQPNLQTE
jgi:O-antigen/teichoic acid export membrane protein